MRLRSLTHLVSSALALSRCERILILGSASLLASFPGLDTDDGPLDSTYDADLLLRPIGKETAALLTEAMGSKSLLQAQNGYYADILHPDIVRSFPVNWESRLVGFDGFPNVFALDPHDLGIVKVCIGREKDLALVRALLDRDKLKCTILRNRLNEVELGEKELFRAGRNLFAVCKGRE